MNAPNEKIQFNESYVGRPVARVEDQRLVQGEGRYIDDVPEPDGVLHAAFVRSSSAHAKIVSIDRAAALKLPGVHAVVVGPELANWIRPIPTPLAEGRTLVRHVLAMDRVRFVGEPVAVVLATSAYVAEDAAELVQIDYEPLPTLVTIDEAMAQSTRPIYDDLPSNVVFRAAMETPGTNEAFAQAKHVFSDTFSSTRLAGVAMETCGFLASYDKGRELLSLWSTAHQPIKERWEIAEALGLPEKNVRVVTPDVGGSFGMKTVTRSEVLVGAALAVMFCRPIKWVGDRQEDLALLHGRDYQFTITLAVDDEGRIVAVRNRPVVNIGAYALWITSAGIDAGGAGHHMMGAYRVPHYAYEAFSVVTNTAPTCSYRGVASPILTFGMETLLMRAAHQLKIDPIEIRQRNLIRQEDLPYRNAVGVVHDTASNLQCLDIVLERSNYREFKQRFSGKPGPDGLLRGIGLACMADHTGQGTSIARARGQASRWPGYDGARVRIEPDGKASLHLSLASQGQGHETVFAQLAADTLGLRMEDVSLETPDTSSTPFGTGAGASRGTVGGGGALIKACTSLGEKMKRIAAHQLKLPVSSMVLSQGRVSCDHDPTQFLLIRQIAAIAYMIGMGDMPPGETIGLDVVEFYDPPMSSYALGSCVAEVAVDPGTGLVKVERFFMAHDCGRVLNPMLVDGQVKGAIVQGIGAVLMEGARYSADGQPMATTLLDYAIPTTLDTPEIILDHVETPSTFTLGGMKGAGESGAIGVVPAIIHAVADALGQTPPAITSMPLTPSVVMQMLGVDDNAGDPAMA
jgi:carbon-monoxide dehydrogenase large subunit